MFSIGDKVYNTELCKKGKIVDIDYAYCGKAYLVKYPIFTISRNPFKRKYWTFGMNLELIKKGEK